MAFHFKNVKNKALIENVEQQLREIPGVERALVDVEDEEVFVEFNNNETDPATILQSLSEQK